MPILDSVMARLDGGHRVLNAVAPDASVTPVQDDEKSEPSAAGMISRTGL
jgi:hypothetical protein